MIISIDNKIEPSHSYAVERTRGLYNVGVEDGSRFQMKVEVPVERHDWQIGVIVGPSGSGKTSIARALVKEGWQDWDFDPSPLPIIELFTEMGGSYEKATAALSAVGLGSVPSWLRPFGVLSNGEQFRASLAALLVAGVRRDPPEGPEDLLPDDYLIDEFTSVLDRQVAQVGAGAFARSWRKVPGRRVVLITPHYDILEWIEPDWWIDTAEGADEFASDRGVVQAREGSFQEARHHGGYPGDEVGTLGC